VDGRTDGWTKVTTDGWTFPPLMLLGRLGGVDLKMGRKLVRGLRPFLGRGGWFPTKSPGLRPTSMPIAIDASSRLATIKMGRKLGGSALFLGSGELVSPSNTKSPGPRPTSIPSGILIHPAIWPQQLWSKNWGALPLWGGGVGSPSNTMWPGPRPTCMPSFILIHPTIWPQYTNVTDRRGRQMGQDRQRSDSTGQTVLETVTQKSVNF